MRSFLTRHNFLWTLLVASLAFNVGFGTTFGVRTYQHYCCGGGAGGPDCAFRQSLPAQLDLTPEQQQGMMVSRDSMLRQVDELRRQLTAEREKLVDLLTALHADRDAIAAQLEQIAAVQRLVQERVVAHLLEEKELLTPEQQAKFNQTIRRRVCPLGRHGPESVPGGCDRHRDCEGAAGANSGSSGQ